MAWSICVATITCIISLIGEPLLPLLRIRLTFVCRLDLSWCLGFGSPPRFADPRFVSWDPLFPNISGPDFFELCLTDTRLVVVFHDVRCIVGLINEHSSQNTKFHGAAFQHYINSVQTRLLLLKDLFHGVDECVCLAMLAFMTTTFHLPGKKMPYHALRRRLQGSFQALAQARMPELQDLLLWVLIVCSISVLDDEVSWLATRWVDVSGRNFKWEEMRWRLQNIMWIDFMHDNLGREAFLKMASGVTSGIIGEEVN